MSEATTHKGRYLPIWMFSHPRMSLADRILLAMSSYTDRSGVCRLDVRTLSVLVGATTRESLMGDNPMKEMKLVRKARQKLVQDGFLEVHEETTPLGHKKTFYIPVEQPMEESVLDEWNRVAGKGKQYEALVKVSEDEDPFGLKGLE
jgi:hypothetical protein